MVRVRFVAHGLTAAWSAMLAACEPALDQRTSVIDEPRVIAVLSSPAEVGPGEEALWHAVVATPGGTVSPDIDWALCLAVKPPTEDNVVNQRCLELDLLPIGVGPAMRRVIAPEACQRFGPDGGTSEAAPPPPDSTGGYFLPVRLALPSQLGGRLAFASQRLRCGLANAPVEVARAYRERYHPNANPPAPEVSTDTGARLLTARAGQRLRLRARWPIDAAEAYVSYDALRGELRERREALRLSWYTTGGALCHDVTGRSEEDHEPSAENCWVAPAEPGLVTLWLVLRDSRGGSAVVEQTIDVH